MATLQIYNQYLFPANAALSGLSLGSNTTNPTVINSGDIWRVGDFIYYKDSAVNRQLATADSTQTITNKSINATNNTITGTASGLTSGNVTTNANLTGDITSIGNASTLATVNTNIGTFNSVTVNAKGLVTAASNVAGGSTINPTIQTGATYTAVNNDYVVINSATHTVTLPTAASGRIIGAIMINPTITAINVKTSAAGQNINGVDRSSISFPIISQYESYMFIGISATDWVIQNASRFDRITAVSGTQDGTNKIFTIFNIPATGSLKFYENGQLLAPILDYTLSGNTVTYIAGRIAPLSTDNLVAYATY